VFEPSLGHLAMGGHGQANGQHMSHCLSCFVLWACDAGTAADVADAVKSATIVIAAQHILFACGRNNGRTNICRIPHVCDSVGIRPSLQVGIKLLDD
jgi:hypothetical protein